MNRAARALRSRPGRIAAFLIGCAAVGGLLGHIGFKEVGRALQQMALAFPACLLLEAAIILFDSLAARSLFGPDRGRLRAVDLARSGLLSYVAMAFMPSGRVFGEATRAAILAERSTSARAAHAAYQMQSAVLVGNSITALVGLIATVQICGWSGYGLAIGVVLLVNLGLGTAMVLMARGGHLGHRVGQWLKSVAHFGAAFDQVALESPPWPLQAIAWIVAGRGLQVAQLVLFFGAASGHYSIGGGLVAEGAHLVGAAAGELIPAQVGAAEANFALYAKAFSTDSAGAVAVALSLHLVVLAWVLVGLVAGLVVPPAESDAPLAKADSEHGAVHTA